jgi:hypothetical protein
MSLNTTAGAGEYTGRAAQYKSAFEREVYGIGAPDNEQEYYRRAAERAVVERAGYTAPSDLGDVRTQQIRKGYGMFSQAVGLAGGEVASDYQMTGRIIETQRQAAYATPQRRDERFFMGELQKWGEIPVEKASAYHDIGMESGKAIPANPYEYQADLAVEFLKGSPDKASEFFSPVSGEMSRYLPSGQGVQEFAWDEAITDYKRQTGAANTPYPEQVSFMQGVTYLGAAEGKYGPYGKLVGGVDNGGVDLAGGRTRGGNIVGGVSSEGIGGVETLPKPFASISQPKAEPNEYKPSGFLGLGGLFPEIPTMEKYRAYSVNIMSRASEAGPVAGLGIIAKEEFGAPISTVAGVASRLSFGASEIIFKPEPITVGGRTLKSERTETFGLPTKITSETINLPQSSAMYGGNQTITDLGNWLAGSRDSIDRTNLEAVKDYNTKADLFSKMQEQNPVFVKESGGTKTITTTSGGTRTVTTTMEESGKKVYASEWDKFVEGSGRVARWVTGLTLAKQESYFTTIKSDSSTIGEAKRGLFYVGTTIVNKPAELAPAAILGWATAGVGAAAPSFLARVGAGTGITAKGATFLLTPGGASLAKAGIVGAFGSAYTYDVTEGLKATPETTKKNIYTSLPAFAAMYGGGGGLNWMGETRIARGVSSPSGATFTGARVYNTYLGGGRTPTGQRYVGAFSPTESYVFTGRGAVPKTRSTVTPQGQLKLPSGSGGYGAETYPSSFEGPARDYTHMDISGGARPFTMKTSPEMQVASNVKFRDMSGKAPSFTVKTQPITPTKVSKTPVVSEVIGDFSGKAQPFTMKTAPEMKAGYWDTAEPIVRGDISGKGSKFSLTTEREFLSSLPRDMKIKADRFSMGTQEEIYAGWESERTLKEQNVENIRWSGEVVSGKVKQGAPTQSEEPYRVATFNEMVEMVKPTKQPATSQQITEFIKSGQRVLSPSEMGGEWVSGFYKKSTSTKEPLEMPSTFEKYKERVESLSGVSYSAPQPQKLGYAPVPERQPFSIPGVSESTLSKELRSMHPAYSEQTKVSTGSKRYPMTLVEREYPYTQIEREALRYPSGIDRAARSKMPSSFGMVVPYQSKRQGISYIPKPSEVTEFDNKVITTFGQRNRNTFITPTNVPRIRDVTKPYSKSDTVITPFKTTTPYEITTPNISEQVKESPWKQITETPRPTDIIYPIEPTRVKPLTGFPLGQLPGGGGGTRQYGGLGVTTWRRNNLVADMPYLAKGMRSISWGMDIGSGTYSEKTQWFKTGKKRKATRRKKK